VPVSTQRLRAVLQWLRIDAEGKQKQDETLVFSNEIGEPLPHFHDACRPDRRMPYAVLRSGRTFGRLPRALIACHRSHFACSVSQI
jgi:hypothetical protein